MRLFDKIAKYSTRDINKSFMIRLGSIRKTPTKVVGKRIPTLIQLPSHRTGNTLRVFGSFRIHSKPRFLHECRRYGVPVGSN